ncbi:hypothetical protein TI39_contig391g00009 [Zymoseptoria brevis]|uniref:Uncharacterized protein n=1 Tax=Zymoseptoria brevis TaxID=1047168 RepID=A0A0F4GRG3_9PEZI|nr:hypothetical protein TI39_contig391g00009 [Zymoseptoria brevis]
MSRTVPRSAAADRDAIAYLQTLTIPEIRAMDRITDVMCGMNAAGSAFQTDEELIGYRNDMMRDLRNGPLQGGGGEVLSAYSRDRLQDWIRRHPTASRGQAPPASNRPANASSLDYSRFESIDTDDSASGSEAGNEYEYSDDDDNDEYDDFFDEGEEEERMFAMLQDELAAQYADCPESLLPEYEARMQGLRDIYDRTASDRRFGGVNPQLLRATDYGMRAVTSAELEQNPYLEQDDEVFRRKVRAIRRNIGVPPRFLTAAELRTEAREKSVAIFKDYQTLQAVLDRHEGTIQKRWMKKTKAQRVKILLAAWPGMTAKHRPDVDAATRGTTEGPRTDWSKEMQEAFTWPNITQEDLAKPRVLPLLLNARARNGPWVFWQFDQDSVSIGNMVGALDEPFLNRHHMVFRGRTTPDTYGELVQFDSTEQGDKVMRERSVPPGIGYVILTIQQRILRFLVDCCEAILHDIPANKLLDYPVLPEPTLAAEKATGLGSLAVLNLEAPYRAPTSIDIAKLKAVFNAKRSAAEDHVWALREDPSYFEFTLRDAMDHRYENVKDSHGMTHPILQHGRENLIWGPVISNAVASAEYYLEIWTKLCEIITDIETEIEAHGGTAPLGQTLHKEVRFQLSYFKMFLKCAMRGPLSQLKAEFLSSPPFRPYVERPQQDTPDSRKTGIHPVAVKETPPTVKAILIEGSPEANLQHLVALLTEEGTRGLYAEHWGFSTVVDELGRLLENEPRARHMVSSRVAQTISELSVITEALRQMIAYAGQIHEVPMPPSTDRKGRKLKGLTLPYYNLLDDIEGAKPEQFYQLGLPTDKRFYYPSDKRRTKENHEAMRAAEARLDAFWHKVDANLEVKRQSQLDHLKQCGDCCDCGVESAAMKLLAQPRYLQRTGVWIDPKTSDADKKSLQDTEPRRLLSDVYFDLQQRTERTLKSSHDHHHGHAHGHSHSHTKTKTRGSAAAGKENVPPAVFPPSEQPDEQPTFHLDARALRVFRTLFYTPSAGATPGEVPWLDFVHAMVATGFEAEKLYGSVWNFRPTRLDVERSIQFHEPHPSGKIAYRICRGHGRRLNRAYGWTGENFVAEGKNAVALGEMQVN